MISCVKLVHDSVQIITGHMMVLFQHLFTETVLTSFLGKYNPKKQTPGYSILSGSQEKYTSSISAVMIQVGMEKVDVQKTLEMDVIAL